MDDKPRILGVDDSLTIRKALELVLKPAGYMLELASSGAEAIEKARGFQPAVVLLDFILPDMRGTEVCRRLAADPETASIPVVLISAKGAEIRQAYQDARNVAAYVVKPFTPETIIETLADVLRRAAAPQDDAAAAAPDPGEVHAGANGAGANGDGHPWPVPAEIPAGEVAFAAPDTGTEDSDEEPLAADSEEGGAAVFDVDEWAERDEAPLDGEPASHGSLDLAFEGLSAGLEGVYVEEADTRGGAAADEAKSYTDLAAQLVQQLDEALDQVRSGARFALCRDGSVRSIDEVLFDAYRRVCRLLFRAVDAGVMRRDTPRGNRVLVACHRDSELFPALRCLRGDGDGAQVLLVSERFRQLPMVTRLYGPTHLVVDLTDGGALADQLGVIEAMPERQRLKIVGIGAAQPRSVPGESARSERVDVVLHEGPDLLDRVRSLVDTGYAPAPRAPTATADDSDHRISATAG